MQVSNRSFFPSRRALTLAGLAIAALLASAPSLHAQDAAPAAPAAQNSTPSPTATAAPAQAQDTLSNDDGKKKKKATKDDKVQQTKDTKKEVKKTDKYNALLGQDSSLPEKQLYDKALAQEKSGHYDVARLDLQTLLNTYPDSQYVMRAKLAVADCWYREGGSAALTQAEQEYNDFITFFPNAPESAEAQMRIGDIYFKQMDIPDRDYTKAVHAQDAYRLMLKQYPEAPKEILEQARQKLREVQEMLATREALNAAFYASHENWAASIARYQTVVDTYPLYSHMDDALIGLGDAWEAQANNIRKQPVCATQPPFQAGCIPEGPKSKIEQEFDSKASDAYRKVVLEHAASPHVEDAKERLVGMNLPVPTPTPEQLAASEAMENSRSQYTISKRLELLVVKHPDTVNTARLGEPTLADPAATVAPAVSQSVRNSYLAAFGEAPKNPAAAGAAAVAPPTDSAPAAAPAAPSGPLKLNDVAGPGEGAAGDSSIGSMTTASPASTSGGTGVGVEILSAPGSAAKPADLPAATGKPDPNYGLPSVSTANKELPPVEAPAAAPDAVNEVKGQQQPAVANNTTTTTNGKKKKKQPKVAEDKNDESSSANKKKGLEKLNPF